MLDTLLCRCVGHVEDEFLQSLESDGGEEPDEVLSGSLKVDIGDRFEAVAERERRGSVHAAKCDRRR